MTGSDDIPEDYYELLGIEASASSEEIKAGYRKEAAQWHPDRTGGYSVRFLAIGEAYETLKDPFLRKAYDKGRTAAPYLTPSEVSWTVTGELRPESVTVRLNSPAGAEEVGEFGPEQLSGTFWAIGESNVVMMGSDLCDFLILPIVADPMEPGEHRDEVRFLVDDQSVCLPIVLTVMDNTVVTGSTASVRTPVLFTERESTLPVRPRRTPIAWDELLGGGFCVALWYFFFAEGWAGFRLWWNPAALIPLAGYLVYFLVAVLRS